MAMKNAAVLSCKQKIEAVVSHVIAEHGFSSAMNDLLPALDRLTAASLDDPDNRAKEREFRMWTKAVKDACARQIEADAIRAHALGICLAG